MQQIKIFKALEHDLTALETRINEWLRESGARVLQISGNIAPQTEHPRNEAASFTKAVYPCSDVVVFVLYERQAQ